jgi:aspartate aminotransferase
MTADIGSYERNRELLLSALSEYGYELIMPEGAFYLFIKCPGGDANAFCEAAKKKDILMVPSDSFGCTGYARISYCVSYDTVKNSLPAFKQLIEEYGDR